ncbi:uncharacterized protein LOC128743598 [Sabethes cyaneus]|uniref:uncharacterized protein LOC128743598 n=1 Tax=Sabethes cyaneus TaxID=53552 RepID=UPI00237D860D|nr:uncharacterized protein LOC128743598 [Sabethes cyaneus]
MEHFCRLCRRNGEFESVSILDSSRSGEIIAVIMQNCLQLQIVPDDGLPQQICNLCQAQLEMFHLLRKISFNSERYFQQLVHQNKQHSSPMVSLPQGIPLNPEVDDFPIAVNPSQPINLPEVKSEPTDFMHEGHSQQSFESSYLHQDIDNTEIKIEPTEISEEPVHYQSTFDNPCETHQSPNPAVASNSGAWGRTEMSMPHEKPQPQERYSCAECGYHSQYKANLYRHIRLRQHSILQSPSQQQDVLKIRQRRRLTLDEILANSNASEMKVYTCNVCGYKTAFKGNADRHQRSQNHHGIDVSIYGRNRSRMDCLMSQRLKYAPEGNYQPTISTSPHVMHHSPAEPSGQQQQQHCLNQAERELLQEIREEFMKINACNSSGMDLFE